MKMQSMTSYEFGEIVLVNFYQSSSADRKKRPALVILDIGDADIVLAPITTKERTGQGNYKITDWQVSSLLRESWVRLAKISCLKKSDIFRSLGRLPNHDKNAASNLWQKLYTFHSST